MKAPIPPAARAWTPAFVMRITLVALLLASAAWVCLACAGCRRARAQRTPEGIWISRAELAALPLEGPAWEALWAEAHKAAPRPHIADQNARANVTVLAKALVHARTGDEESRRQVIDAILAAIGTERGGRTLALGRKLVSYVIAADLVGLPEGEDRRFRAWLRSTLTEELDGWTLRSTHERRPNNWGTHAGASRVAVACYLGLEDELARCARVFKGWLGDRSAHAGFEYGERSWQADRRRPVGINRRGATRDGHSIDGVLPDDQRRSGPFTWPPPRENYVYEALQGGLVQAHILHRAGYAVWDWEDRALLRAFTWLHREADYPPRGDDTWQAPLIDRVYGTSFWDGSPTRPGKSLGWTDWTHAR
ncbi:MAG: alginate lyase family protein [Candidatus Krumholzibacteriia bacterium]